MFEEAIIALFTFNLFDSDHSGALTPDEMKHLVQVVHEVVEGQAKAECVCVRVGVAFTIAVCGVYCVEMCERHLP
jgi:hypothetical protein